MRDRSRQDLGPMRVMDRLHARLAGLSRPKVQLLALPEPRTPGSFVRGRQLCAGNVLLGGHLIQIPDGGSLFGTATFPKEFGLEAQGFGWLADLAAVGDAAAQATAQHWLASWQRLYGRGRGPGWSAELTGRRVAALLEQSMFLLASRDASAAEQTAGSKRSINADASPRLASGLGSKVNPESDDSPRPETDVTSGRNPDPGFRSRIAAKSGRSAELSRGQSNGHTVSQGQRFGSQAFGAASPAAGANSGSAGGLAVAPKAGSRFGLKLGLRSAAKSGTKSGSAASSKSDNQTAAVAAFARTLGRHALYLERRWQRAPHGLPRLEALWALILLGRVLKGMERLVAPAAKAMGQEAARLIDQGGAIPSRNPEELLAIFSLLTRAAQALHEADLRPSPEHLAALEQIAPILRGLRHADGALARFHGGDRGDEGKLDQALATSGVRTPAQPGLAMGYCRLSHGRSTLIIDAAAPPLGVASRLAQASTLGIELTSGRRPIVVSAGPGQVFGPDWQQAARATASHSTVEILEYSSSRLGRARDGGIGAYFADIPSDVRVQKTSDEAGTEALVSHDGYVETHGLTHMRRISLSADGRAVLGEDTLAAVKSEHQRLFDAAFAGTAETGIPYALRFHLHPDVEASLEPGGASVLLVLRSGESWSLRHDGVARLTIEPSAYLDGQRLKPLASKQVVLSAAAMDYASRVRWSLAKAPDAPLSTRDLLRTDTPWLEEA